MSFSNISTCNRLHSLRCIAPIRLLLGHRPNRSPTFVFVMIFVRVRLERSAPVCLDRSMSRRAIYPRCVQTVWCVVTHRLSFFCLTRHRSHVFFFFIFLQRCLNEESSFPTQLLSDSVFILPTSITDILWSPRHVLAPVLLINVSDMYSILTTTKFCYNRCLFVHTPKST